MKTSDIDPKEYQKIQKRVSRIRSFYSSVVTFFFVNLLLLVINLLSSPHDLWFYWVTIIWGIVLILQGIRTFTIKDQFLGEKWEKKKIDELLQKERKETKRRSR